MADRNKPLLINAGHSLGRPRGSATSNKQKWAEPKDWNERIREAVTKLYFIDGKPLKDVISIMANEYGHHATKRMYLTRIQAWGLIKNKTEGDMTFILHKTQQRQILGKNTNFVVRGRPVSYEDAYDYFERKKKMPNLTSSRPPTPSHIFYRTPSPPPRLHVSEELFSSVKAYYDVSYTSKLWKFRDALCEDVRTGSVEVPILEEFHACCQSATNFIQQKSFVDARRILSTGFGLIRSILEQEHPSTLYYLLEALCRLRSYGLYQIDVLIRTYIRNMCSIVLPNQHAWATIWRLLGAIDSDDISEVMLQCWKCANDSAERHLGRFDPWTISGIIDQNHMRLLDDKGEELALRNILLECDAMPDGEHKAMARAKILFNLGNCLENLKRYDEEEIVAMELETFGRTAGFPHEELKGVVLAAPAQAKLGKIDKAEASFKRSVILIDNFKDMGPKSPWAIQQLGRLEEFLRSVGRDVDADTVKADMTSRLQQHHRDLEFEVVDGTSN